MSLFNNIKAHLNSNVLIPFINSYIILNRWYHNLKKKNHFMNSLFFFWISNWHIDINEYKKYLRLNSNYPLIININKYVYIIYIIKVKGINDLLFIIIVSYLLILFISQTYYKPFVSCICSIINSSIILIIHIICKINLISDIL